MYIYIYLHNYVCSYVSYVNIPGLQCNEELGNLPRTRSQCSFPLDLEIFA